MDAAEANIRLGKAISEIDHGIDACPAAVMLIGGVCEAVRVAVLRRQRPTGHRVSAERWRLVTGALRAAPNPNPGRRVPTFTHPSTAKER